MWAKLRRFLFVAKKTIPRAFWVVWQRLRVRSLMHRPPVRLESLLLSAGCSAVEVVAENYELHVLRHKGSWL